MEMNLMVDELFDCNMPNASLNGKPVIITITLEELTQKFDK
jgi:DNA mismatch repair protein MutL